MRGQKIPPPLRDSAKSLLGLQSHSHRVNCRMVVVAVLLSGGFLINRPSLGEGREGRAVWESVLQRDGTVRGEATWVDRHSELLLPCLEVVFYDEQARIRVTAQLVGGTWYKVKNEETGTLLGKLALRGGDPCLDKVLQEDGNRVVCYRVDEGVGLMFFNEHWRIRVSVELLRGEPRLTFYDSDEKARASFELGEGGLYLVFWYRDQEVRAKLQLVESGPGFAFCDNAQALRAVVSLARKDSYFDFYETDGRTRFKLERLRTLGFHELGFFGKDGDLAFSAP